MSVPHHLIFTVFTAEEESTIEKKGNIDFSSYEQSHHSQYNATLRPVVLRVTLKVQLFTSLSHICVIYIEIRLNRVCPKALWEIEVVCIWMLHICVDVNDSI